MKRNTSGGFTLLELLVVIAIIGILAAIVMVSLSDSRMKGRDAARKSQSQEILKALELYYSDNGFYPGHNLGTSGYLDGIDASFYTGDAYMKRLPEGSGTDYYYCVSTDQNSAVFAVNTEQDFGGSDLCHITRGPGPDFGCSLANISASDPCSTRF